MTDIHFIAETVAPPTEIAARPLSPYDSWQAEYLHTPHFARLQPAAGGIVDHSFASADTGVASVIDAMPAAAPNPDHLVISPLKVLENNGGGPLQEHIKAFADQHKVALAVDHGQLVYTLNAGGKAQELFRTAASDAGLQQGEIALGRLAAQEKQELIATYHVAFAPGGEVVGKAKDNPYSQPGNVDVKARDPELIELAGVRAALERSVPGNFGKDGESIKFYFLAGKLIQSINPLATFQPDKDGRSSVYLWPELTNLTRATEADLTPAEHKLPFTDAGRPESIAGAVTHELGHNQFNKLGYNKPGKGADGQTELTDSGVKLINQMGWQHRRDGQDADYNWFLVGKSKDDNGQPATYMPGNDTGMSWGFKRWRLDGGAVDKNGKIVPADKVQSLSTDEMAREAVVPLPTSYFENPEEEYAESVKLFRLGVEGRTALRDSSPQLYKIIEQNDQTEINAAYGVDSSGAAKKIRNIDCALVNYSAEEERRRADFDSRVGN